MVKKDVATINKNTEAMPLSQYIKNETMQSELEKTLGDGAREFTASVISLANTTPAINNCEKKSVIAACLTAASFKLPIGSLGLAHIVPYNGKAQFQMGWKGFVQLAQRSGQFRTINATDVKEGEIKSHDRLSGEIEFEWVEDEREKKPTVGYVAYFELLNGFRKMHYMTAKELETHARRYSQSFKSGSGVWKDNFDAMAKKTVLKLLLASYAPISVDPIMAKAIEEDQKADGKYIDNMAHLDVERQNHPDIIDAEVLPDNGEIT